MMVTVTQNEQIKLHLNLLPTSKLHNNDYLFNKQYMF